MRRSNLWYEWAIIYELDVRTFFDSNGDGWGDFGGLIQRLDYISSLGCTCIWLKPFNPSPLRDGGYDVTDYYGVDPRVGNLGDFVEFMEEAASRGLAVITELVANHTSIDHPWFVEAASDPESEVRGLYIWRDEPASDDDSPKRITFTGDDTSVWEHHDASDQYYLHRFYPHEPDLNNADERVQEEMCRILAYYLRLGVSGFRIDAAPYVAEKAAEHPEFDSPHDYLRRLRSFVTNRRPDAVLMAEADVEPEGLDEYFGDGDEMNLLLNFLLSQYLLLALAEQSAEPLHELLDVMPRPPRQGNYANFLRNHDELDLERLADDKRKVVMEAFAPDPAMRIFGRGIRRRLAPMLGGDLRRIRLAHSLLFSMPGTPVVYYGDEIGMGEDLALEERQPVRTPMQWSSDRNAGFSTSHASDLYLLPVSDGPFAYSRVNVADQQGDPDSMLNWTRRLIDARKQAMSIFNGDWRLLETGDPSVFALGYDNDGEVLVICHNLSEQETNVKLSEAGDMSHLVDLVSDDTYAPSEPDSQDLMINGQGFRWLRGRIDEGQG
jgi:maltose alpha-D-glucosyltransferase / alpha-amylase